MVLKQKVIEVVNVFYDLKNFLKFSFDIKNIQKKDHYVAFLTKQYHTVEKGLALPKPKLGFGKNKIEDLLLLTTRYINNYGQDDLTKNIVNVLVKYLEYHEKNNFTLPFFAEIKSFILGKDKTELTGGVRPFVNPNIDYKDYELFVKSRASVRDFKDKEVDDLLVKKAVNIAKYTPSVCNRQGWKVHAYSGDYAQKMLKLQNGNGGFGSSIKTVVVITGDMLYFSNNERNQISVDSGMFSMSLILAFYSLGIGSCALNTCFSIRSEKRVKKAGGIPDNEKVIMYLAIGYATDDCVVAKSLRRGCDSFISFH